jgi:hypothetical protein
MVMNKLCKTRKRARALIEMAFLGVRLGAGLKTGKIAVKQPVDGGTYLHKG